MSHPKSSTENAVRKEILAKILQTLLDGATCANARLPWGPGPVDLPDDPAARAALVRAHCESGSATVTFAPAGREPQPLHVEALELAGLCPRADGLCRWLAVDLDGPDHGAGGLADPVYAARVIAERCDAAGLYDGLLVTRSRGGQGRHLWLLLPEPTPLGDAVAALAALVASAYRVAAVDVGDDGGPHAFATASGDIATPGQAGAVELIPRSDQRPARGWALTLPAPARIVDPFTDQPTTLATMPRCDAAAWARFVREARAAVPRPRPVPARRPVEVSAPAGELHARTRGFLTGRVVEGARNAECYAAACNLLAAGIPASEAESLIMAAAVLCGLPKREARTAFESARKSVHGKAVA